MQKSHYHKGCYRDWKQQFGRKRIAREQRWCSGLSYLKNILKLGWAHVLRTLINQRCSIGQLIRCFQWRVRSTRRRKRGKEGERVYVEGGLTNVVGARLAGMERERERGTKIIGQILRKRQRVRTSDARRRWHKLNQHNFVLSSNKVKNAATRRDTPWEQPLVSIRFRSPFD